jgi:exo-beta-1,3-glucanase (GH17 family)
MESRIGNPKDRVRRWLCASLVVLGVVSVGGQEGYSAGETYLPQEGSGKKESLGTSIGAKFAAKECMLRNGIAYSPFRDGQSVDPHDPAPTPQQIEEDLKTISGFTHHIRVYSAKDTYAIIPGAATKLGMEVMQGIYLGEDPNVNKLQIEAALRAVRAGGVRQQRLIVGNEVLTGKKLSKQQLIAYIRDIKKQIDPARVQISTAETWGVWKDNPDLAAEVNFVTAHFYPFWEGKEVEGAAQTVIAQYVALSEHLRKQLGRDIKIVIGETGWPSAGIPHGSALPSPENQRKYLAEFLPLACGRSIPFFYFAAFDEEWKWREGNSDWEYGSSWGIFQSSGKLKPALADLFDGPPPGTRTNRDIFVNDVGLLAYYGMGVESSEKQHAWVKAENGLLRMAYPTGQYWGSVFITVGDPGQRPHPWKDFSGFTRLSIEMKGEKGGEEVEIGIMHNMDPATGQERKVRRVLGNEYKTYDIPLSDFASSRLTVPEGLKQLYVVTEFVFEGRQARTVYVRNIQFKP